MITVPTTVSKVELKVLEDLVIEHFETTGESTQDFAKRSGLKRNFVSLIKNRDYKSSPSLDNVKKILLALNLELVISPAE